MIRGGADRPGASSSKKPIADAELEKLQLQTFGYFLHETNPANGLVKDKTAADWPASSPLRKVTAIVRSVALEEIMHGYGDGNMGWMAIW